MADFSCNYCWLCVASSCWLLSRPTSWIFTGGGRGGKGAKAGSASKEGKASTFVAKGRRKTTAQRKSTQKFK